MKSTYDYRRSALRLKGYFGRENEMLLSWAKDGGAKSGNVSEALIEYLHLNGAESENIEDAWDEIYAISGLSGSHKEMALSFWRDLEGDIPLIATAGWTGKELCHE